MRANLSSCETLETCTEDGSRQWRQAPAMLTPRHAFAMASLSYADADADADAGSEGEETARTALYATGGWLYGSCCSDAVERFVEGEERWTRCAPLRTARRLHGAAAVNGRLFVFGGACGNGTVDAKIKTASVEMYIPDEDRWEGRRDLPRPMHVSAVALGPHIFVLPYGDDHMLRYDPEADSYVDVGPLPLPNFHCFSVCASPSELGVFYVVGGSTDGKWTAASWRYCAKRQEWDRLPEMAVARRRSAAAVVWAR